MEINRICPSCMNGEIVSGGVCKSCGSSLLMRQTVDYALPLQTILHGRYLLGRVLGQGGFGITYVAYDLINNKRVVIKELFPVFLVTVPKPAVQRPLFERYGSCIHSARAACNCIEDNDIFLSPDRPYHSHNPRTAPARKTIHFFLAEDACVRAQQIDPVHN